MFATKLLNLAIKAEYLKQLRVPICSDQRIIENLVCRILKGKNEDNDTLYEEQEIDRLVYKLYDLTYDEVKIVDPYTPITEEEYNIV